MNDIQKSFEHALRATINYGGAYDYSLTDSAVLPIPATLIPPAECRNDWIRVADHGSKGWHMTIAPGYTWDGCSLAEDFCMGTRHLSEALLLLHVSPRQAIASAGPLLGSLGHDPGYQFKRDLAKAWGCTDREVLIWANAWFRWLMLEAGTPQGKVRRYYFAVTTVGPAYNWATGMLARLNPFSNQHNKGKHT